MMLSYFLHVVGVVGVPYNIRLAESTTRSLTISWSVSVAFNCCMLH